MSEDLRILIVDDEPNIRSGLLKGLAKESEHIETAGDVNEAIEKFNQQPFEIVIADVRLPGDRNGLDLVALVRQRVPETTVLVITAHGTVETAVEAMRRGAFDFISKPVDLNLIRQQVRKAGEHHRLRREISTLKNRLAEAGAISGIIGSSTIMQDLFQQIRQVAATDATVFIQGESGTGKELIARAVHELSVYSQGPFIAINLGALPDTLLESELFGHEKGSFTGASRQKPGCFEQARGGTLFLDEITEIPPKCQVDLLRVLETGQFARIGGEEVLSSDARVVSATNKNAHLQVEEGTFREDLFYRLNVLPIFVPALRERRDDIPLLADHFLEHFCERHKRSRKTLSDGAMQVLVNAKWPGNIRQLRNAIERMVVTINGNVIQSDDLPNELHTQTEIPSNKTVMTMAEVTERAEKEAIVLALGASGCHRERAAELLDISVRTLHYKMSRYGLH